MDVSCQQVLLRKKASSWLSRRMWRRHCESRENWFMPLGVLRVQLVHFSCCAQPHTECVSLLLLFFFHFLLAGKFGRFIRTRSVYLSITRKMLKWKNRENQNTFHFHVSHLSLNFLLLCPALPVAAADPVNFPTRSCIRVHRLSKRKSKYISSFSLFFVCELLPLSFVSFSLPQHNFSDVFTSSNSLSVR